MLRGAVLSYNVRFCVQKIQRKIVKRDILHKNVAAGYDILHRSICFERDILRKKVLTLFFQS